MVFSSFHTKIGWRFKRRKCFLFSILHSFYGIIFWAFLHSLYKKRGMNCYNILAKNDDFRLSAQNWNTRHSKHHRKYLQWNFNWIQYNSSFQPKCCFFSRHRLLFHHFFESNSDFLKVVLLNCLTIYIQSFSVFLLLESKNNSFKINLGPLHEKAIVPAPRSLLLKLNQQQLSLHPSKYWGSHVNFFNQTFFYFFS